eukprot:6208434-Pleurochrysis_carterae.AAC.2
MARVLEVDYLGDASEVVTELMEKGSALHARTPGMRARALTNARGQRRKAHETSLHPSKHVIAPR